MSQRLTRLYRRAIIRPLRRTYRRLRHRQPEGTVTTKPPGTPARPLPDFRFFAVLGTWMEEDIVEATVRNAFAQGVDAVYLVDNASTDATVERAVAAGATVAEIFATPEYQERVRILFMNGVVARVSLAADAAHAWWLWLDADEFPEGPDGMTIADYLRTVDQDCRLVGSTYYNHFPGPRPAYLPGFHPLEFQPLCERFWPDRARHCAQPHWKHPLQRFDRDGAFLLAMGGFHSASLRTGEPLVEPAGGIVTHHFQYREESFTRSRLELLVASTRNDHNETIGNTDMKKRFASLDAVYAQRWQDVDSLRRMAEVPGVHPERWTDSRSIRRWYTADDLAAAQAQWGADHPGPGRPAP
jgi:glycosyltransferase involved in cell wall biosynthesis